MRLYSAILFYLICCTPLGWLWIGVTLMAVGMFLASTPSPRQEGQ